LGRNEVERRKEEIEFRQMTNRLWEETAVKRVDFFCRFEQCTVQRAEEGRFKKEKEDLVIQKGIGI
jgi:hypothetical protein